ncbi:hypothetical protein MKW94_004283 [Papaver nudicaule]|uniref:SHSP domain-containing protein n=1 Tax=Papaver nudicaule TaxID=74823 RepID=A0AA41VYF2_PAPNU|nr:hypothetical protein [Papaver nudicaule]
MTPRVPQISGTYRCLWKTWRWWTSHDVASVIAKTNVDWRETDNAHIFCADLPGVRKEEVKVQIEDGNILQISGEHTEEEERNQKDSKWHRYERRRGSFSRRFRLPENAKVDDIKCTMENGVLTVFVPKQSDQDTPKNVRSIDIA